MVTNSSSSSLSRDDIFKRLKELDIAQAQEQKILDDLLQERSPLGYMRDNSNKVVTSLILTFSLPMWYDALSTPKNPDIFDVPAVVGNWPTIQNAAENDLKGFTTPDAVDQRLKEKVTTTDAERKTRQTLATCYALNNKKWYVNKQDGKASELMNATEVYNQLASELAKNPNYKQPVAMIPQQKVAYDITFCLQQLWYGKDRIFDTKDYIYTNDLIIAIMDFQNDKNIKRDGIVGPETFRHLLQSLKINNGTIIVDVPNTNDMGNVVTNDTIAKSANNNQNTISRNDAQNISKDTVNQIATNTTAAIDTAIVINKSETQVTLEKYFTGRELWFITPTVDYLVGKKDSAQLLIQEITAIDKSTDPLVDKKATLLSALEKYGIKNELVVLEDDIKFYQQAKDSLMVDSLTTKRDELLKKMEFAVVEQKTTGPVNTVDVAVNPAIDRLTKKNLSKKWFKKFKKAIIAIVWWEPDETSNIEVVTRQSLIQQEVLPENLDMSFDEFSSLKPENFIALLNTNKAKRN